MTINSKPMANLALFTGLSTDPRPGLREDDFGSHLLLTDKKQLLFWDGDQWVPLSSGRVIVVCRNPYSLRTAVNGAADTTPVTLATFTIPGGLLNTNSVLRISLFYRTTSSASQKNVRILSGTTQAYLDQRTTITGAGVVATIIWNGSGSDLTTGVCFPFNGEANSSNSALVSVPENFAQDRDFSITGHWTAAATAGEIIQLDHYKVEVIVGG